MRNKYHKSKLLLIGLILFLCPFLFKAEDTLSIYRETLSTTVNLTVLDPNANYVVTLELNDGTGNTRTEYRSYNQELGSITAPTRADYNFLGWYDANDNRIYSDELITQDVTFYAKWQKIVCKKVTDDSKLHQETCESGGCRVSGLDNTFPVNSTITYGTTYGPMSPIAGDAYDCDVNDDGIYDGQTEYGKYNERFYFLRQISNGNDEPTAALVYYTSFDSRGPYDSIHTPNLGSTNYTEALTWLPTSSSGSDPWDNAALIDFDANNGGQISRFLSFDDISAVCGTLSGNADVTYFKNCGKWFIFENTRFQSADHGRAGIWLQMYNNNYHRIQTQSLKLEVPQNGVNSDNTARPVIEIPLSAFEGYKNSEKHLISFNTHGGTPQVANRRVYTGDSIGTIDTVTKKHYTFDGWYATYSNGVYSNPVSATTIVDSDMTLHAKWNPVPTSTITFNANGGTINGESTFDVLVDTGEAIDVNDIPTATYLDHTFDGWYMDTELTEAFDETEEITEDITVYAAWITGNSVARVNGVGYDTLAEAIAAVPTGTSAKTTVTILKDITLTEAVEIPSNKWVELDGGNHTISGSVSLITNKGKLDVISGTISSAGTVTANTLITNVKNATLNISGGTLVNNCTANAATEFLAIANKGTVNISGGTLMSYGQSATINNSATLNITGGQIIAHNTTKGQAVYMDGGTTTISGDAYLENVSGGSEVRATVDNSGGTLIITGGTIVSKGYSAVMIRANGSTTRIGADDNLVDISSPILRGKNYGLEKGPNTSTAIIEVYDGIFESIDQTQAISTTSVTKPTDIDFKTDGTMVIEGVTYHTAYLLAPSIPIYFFEDENGTANPVVIDNGSQIGSDLPTPNPREGYYFTGWYINGDPLQPVTSSTVVMGTFNAYAIWVQSVSNATMDSAMSIQINQSDIIEFEEDDIEAVSYSSSDNNVATVDDDGTVHAVGVGTATITITGNLSNETRTVSVTVTQIMHTVYFYDTNYNPNDLEHSTLLASVQVVSGSAIGTSNMPHPGKENYVLDTWYIEGNSATPFTSATTVSGDINVVANWKEKISYATLTTTPSPFKVLVGDTGNITLTATTEGDEIEGYTFTSENESFATVNSTTGEVTGEGIGDTYITVTGSLSGETIQVPVSIDVLKYTVTFKDGNTVIKTVEVEPGLTVGEEMPANQTKAGYIFNGWVFDDNNNLTPFTSSTQVYGDIDIFAYWKEKISIATLPSDPITLMLGATKQDLVTPTSEGLVEDYTLSSSNTNYVEIDGKSIFGAGLGTITLTITGVESGDTRTITVNVVNSYNVTFDPDNGDTETVIAVEVGTSIDDSGETLPTDPTKTGYVFDRWYLYDETNQTLTTTPLDTSAAVNSDLIYKAKWVSDTYVAAVYGATTSYHTTLQAAFNAVPTSGTATEVKLLQDIINPSGQTKVTQGRSVILNGGNYKVQCGEATTNQMIFNENGTLRVISGTYLCGKDKLAVFENYAGMTLYIDGGYIENTSTSAANARGAIFNNGAVEITGGTLKSGAQQRGVVQNAKSGSSILMSGGTVIQTVSSTMGALHNGVSGSSITITGGTVTSVGNAIQNVNGTTLTVGTQDSAYDATSPVIQGDLYGITSTVNYSIYDGIIKGKSSSKAVNDFAKITGTETGSDRVTGTEGSYYTLYYEFPQSSYVINFDAGDGTVSPTSLEYNLNTTIDGSNFPTPTRENHYFNGWYTDSNFQTPFAEFTPTSAETVTYYAKWTFNSSLTPVTHNILSNAMQEYFANVSSWVSTDATDPSNEPPGTVAPQTKTNYDNGHHLFKDSIDQVFTENGCSPCGENNSCNNPQEGTYCDQPGGYDTGLTDDLNVYFYENGEKSQDVVSYITSTGGKIYNMIPGVTYYWESATDNTKYGVVEATGSRRTLKTSVRNLRDLGGLSASNSDVSGTIDYGRLYRGAYISSAQGVTDLTKLGITREVDLRENGDGVQTYKLSNYDTGTSSSYTDIKITNYIINPVATTYILNAYPQNYAAVKSSMRTIMEKVVFDHDSIYFHCTIGTDRTGTMAYFLEGLLGVSEEDRLRDYELTYFFGLTNRTRFHDTSNWSNTAPRFYSMYRSYPTNQDIYNYYTHESHTPDPNDPNDLTDDELLRRFRLELIH